MARTIILCAVLAILVFSIQLALCFKSDKKSVKRIPVYIIFALYLTAVIMCLVDMLDGNGGVAIWVIFAYIISVANTVALLGDVAAWLVYKQIKMKKCKSVRQTD